MTLPAGEIAPDRVDVLGLFLVAVVTTQHLIKFYALVGVDQACPDPDLGCCRTVRKAAAEAWGGGDQRLHAARHNLIILIIAGAGLTIFIASKA
jgi:hypothetical protein